jgi:hypothetical protein
MLKDIIYSVVREKYNYTILKKIEEECGKIIDNLEINLNLLHKKYKLNQVESIIKFIKKDTDIYERLKRNDFIVTYVDLNENDSLLSYYTINILLEITSCYNFKKHLLFSTGGNLGSILSLLLSRNILVYSIKHKSKCYLFFTNKKDILNVFKKYNFKSLDFNNIKILVNSAPFKYPIIGVSEIYTEGIVDSIVLSSLTSHNYKLFKINNDTYSMMKGYLYMRGFNPYGYYNWVDIPPILIYHKNLDNLIKKLFNGCNFNNNDIIENILSENNDTNENILFNDYLILTKILFEMFNVPPFLLSLENPDIIRTESRVLEPSLIFTMQQIIKDYYKENDDMSGIISDYFDGDYNDEEEYDDEEYDNEEYDDEEEEI